jgi:hypothetical protein
MAAVLPQGPDALPSEHEATLAAVASVLAPLAKLCIGKGIPIQAVEAMTRKAFVMEAAQVLGAGNPDRAISRISTVTGLTRREVTRLCQSETLALPPTRSHANMVLTRWISHPEYTGSDGKPRPLARTGDGASFDGLARGVTQDVHPRSILAELERLGLVEVSEDGSNVSLLTSAFVAHGDWPRLMGFLGENVGDHLHAAVVNVLGSGNEHFEQSLLADELSAQAMVQVRELIARHWSEVLASLGPKLEALMAADKAAGRPQDQQVRIGFFSWTQPMQTLGHLPVPSEMPRIRDATDPQ